MQVGSTRRGRPSAGGQNESAGTSLAGPCSKPAPSPEAIATHVRAYHYYEDELAAKNRRADSAPRDA